MSEAFSHEIVVDETDIDFLGHASNVSVVRWVQDTALAHSNAVGLDIATYRKLGAIFVVVRHEIDYLRPALRGDVLDAKTWVPRVLSAKCFRSTEFTRKSDGQLLAKGVTTWAFMDLATGRPLRFSDTVRIAFGWGEAVPGARGGSVAES
jgi:acyl-CoA thioester hydrolase